MAKPDQRLTSSDWSVILHMTRELRTIEADFRPNSTSIDGRKLVVLCGVKRLHRPLKYRSFGKLFTNSYNIYVLHFLYFWGRLGGALVMCRVRYPDALTQRETLFFLNTKSVILYH